MKKIIFRSCLVALAATSLFTITMHAQKSNEDPIFTKQDRLSPTQISTYLRQPDGLQKLSSAIGDNVVFTENGERWGEETLSSLTRASDRVVIAIIEDRKSQLIENGDSISTVYSLRPIESIIGTGDESIEVTYAGGEVVFPNGRGTIPTPYWDGLKVGAKYIFFLKNDNNRLDSVGKDQGVLELRDSDDSVHTLGKFAQIVHWNERLERHLSSP